MTAVILHGVLAKEFGTSFNFELGRAKDVVRAIDANKKNFSKRLSELAIQGFHYTLILDGKKMSELTELEIKKQHNRIDIVPMILGAGPIPFIGAILTAISGGLTAIGGAIAASSFLTSLALGIVSIGLQMLLAPKPDSGAPISATTRAFTDSFLFSNKANLASQGSPIPVGYGRLKVGSQVIQFCVKSFPQSESSTRAMATNPFQLLSDTENNQINTISNRA
jgi:predicted phage tail protein